MDVGNLVSILEDLDQSFTVYVRINGQDIEVTDVAPLVIPRSGSYDVGYVIQTIGGANTDTDELVKAHLAELGYC